MLTIVSVAYPLAPVTPDAVGGAEQVVSALDAAIVASGHRSIVVAQAGSVVTGELRAIAAQPAPFTPARMAAAQEGVRRALAEVAEGASLVHLHGIDFAAYLPPPGPPALVTLHLPIAWYGAETWHLARPDTWFNCVSATQAAGADVPWVLPPIHNGVDTAYFGAVRHGKRAYAMALGRICPEKAQHVAARAARRARCTLLIGGQVYPYPDHVRYFDDVLRPHLGAECRFLGPLDRARMRRLLAGARCLLVTSTAPETSSLVAMEALACGTPVVSFRCGALPELIEHGRTGFLVDTEAEMADAIIACASLDGELCRRDAAARFSRARMCADYLARYHDLAGR